MNNPICPHCGGDVYSEFEERNAKIVAARKAGKSLKEVAAEFGVTAPRVSAICGKARDRESSAS